MTSPKTTMEKKIDKYAWEHTDDRFQEAEDGRVTHAHAVIDGANFGTIEMYKLIDEKLKAAPLAFHSGEVWAEWIKQELKKAGFDV